MSVPIGSAKFSRIPHFISRDGSLSIAAKAVLLALMSHANEAATCWPSLSTLSVETGLSKSSVQRGISALRERGFLSIRHTGRSNRYLLDLRLLSGHTDHSDRSLVTTEEEPVKKNQKKNSLPLVSSSGWENPWAEEEQMDPEAVKAAWDEVMRG